MLALHACLLYKYILWLNELKGILPDTSWELGKIFVLGEALTFLPIPHHGLGTQAPIWIAQLDKDVTIGLLINLKPLPRPCLSVTGHVVKCEMQCVD